MKRPAIDLIFRVSCLVFALSLGASGGAQSRPEIEVNDTMVSPESITHSQDGAVIFGSTAKGTIYRAAPGAAKAEAWILPGTTGLINTLGVFADDKSNTLWVCSTATGGRRGTPPVGETTLRTYDLRSGAVKAVYPFPGGGFCNDIAIAADGTAYATDTTGGRILRLRPGSKTLDVWVADKQLAIVDGIALLADGSVYVNTFTSGRLFRVPVGADGAAGTLTELELSIPLMRPDGLRTVGRNRMLQASGNGRLEEITINGNRAEVRILREGLTAATAVTLVGDTAYVLIDRLKAVPVPYTAPK
jgi:sugar lactone lactonase YvrE